MTTILESALMAGASYISTRDKINRLPAPEGWNEKEKNRQVLPSGFEATYFTKDTEIVISFAGTGPGFSDWDANSGLATGIGSEQLNQAALYYLQVIKDNEGKTISFTGHSLGGGLAALMGIFFDKPAVTFDQAPFAKSASTLVRGRVITYLNENGYDNIRLAELVPELLSYTGNGERTTNVTGRYVEKEFLQNFPFQTLGIQTPIRHGEYSGAIDLHSQGLLIAFLQSTGFRAVTESLPDLLKMVFDENLFAYTTDPENRTNSNLLELLVRHQVGGIDDIPVGGDAMLTRFASDLGKLVPAEGGTTPDPLLSDALIAFAMEKYVRETSASPGYHEELFSATPGGVQFNTTDIAQNLLDAKGYARYFTNFLASGTLFSVDELVTIKSQFATLNDWSVALGATGMKADDTANNGALMLGNSGADTLTGGSGNDLLAGSEGKDRLLGGDGTDTLFGGTGDDTLDGGTGADQLQGGAGNDSYTAGNGDVIVDSDGLGRVTLWGATLSGGRAVGTNRWQDASGNNYLLIDGAGQAQDLSIQSGSASLLIKDFHEADLGIRLIGEEAPPPLVQSGNGITVTGDRVPYQMAWDYWLWVNNPAWPYLFDTNGNMVRTNVPSPFYADKIFDTAGDDIIKAGDGFNVIFAYSGGNNRVQTGANDDYILGGAGRDEVAAGGMVDTVSVGAGDDIVFGEGGRDVIDGGAGDDFLAGGTDADAIFGGAGNDTIYAEESTTWRNSQHDTDASVAGPGEVLAGGTGDDRVIGGATADALLGGEGKDALAGREGDDVLFGDSSLDFVAPALTEFDPIIAAQRWPMGPNTGYHSPFSKAPMLQISVERKVTAGVNTVTLTSRSNPEAPRENWLTTAVAGDDDQLAGGSGNDWLFGEFGNDLLDGGRGNDLLIGGVGNDTYVFRRGDGQDVVLDEDATPGNLDTVLFTDMALGELRLKRASSNLTISARDSDDRVTLTNGFAGGRFQIERMVFADGTTLDAAGILAALENSSPTGSVTVAGPASQYATLSVSNTLADEDGLGEIGYRWEVSGDGNDWTAITGATGDTFTLTQAEVGRAVRAVATYTDGIERQESVTSIATAAIMNINDAPTGSVSVGGITTQNQTLIAGNSLDDLDGLGAIVWQWQSAADSVSWTDIAGATSAALTLTQAQVGWQVRALARYTDASGTAEAMVSAPSATVANVNDAPSGTVFVGGDAVQGTVLQASAGLVDADGMGIVSYRWQFSVDGTAWTDIENASTASLMLTQTQIGQQLRAVASYTDGGGTAESVTSAASQPVKALYVGGAGNDLLTGSTTTDVLAGGNGNDTYLVNHRNDVVIEAANAGTDLIRASVSTTLPDNVENLTLTGTAAIDGTGNSLANLMLGNASANTLSGLAGDDTLIGGSANDTLDGGAGADRLMGGSGNDTYVVDAGDTVFEADHAGIDTVISGASWTLGDHLEKLVLSGNAAINGTGNTLDNVLTGNGSDNVLTGGKGADTMLGGAGNDTYVFDDRDDVIIESANDGIDVVQSSQSLVLPDNVEVLRLTGKAGLHGTGNALDNLLCGNAGNNVLDGGAGRDILQGANGNDTLSDRSGNAVFSGGAGKDKLLGGDDAALFIGGLGDDILSSGAGNDVFCFNAGDGRDTLAAGGSGHDTLSLGGGITDDALTFNRSGKDLVLSVSKNDRITFEDWYAATPTHPVVNLQLLVDAMEAFDASAGDPSPHRQVEVFDFASLVSAFDAARADDSHLKTWGLVNAMASCQRFGSDTAAYGGDLAWQYGQSGSLLGIGFGAAQSVIGDPGFGSQAQALHPLAGLQSGPVRLV